MKKIISVLLCVMLLAGCCVSCASANGYEKCVDQLCNAMEKGNFKTISGLVDWKHVDALKEIEDEDYDAKEAREEAEDSFKESIEDLEYEFEKRYSVEHGNIKELDNEFNGKSLEQMKKLIDKKNDGENPDITAFVNEFVAGLDYVQPVKTNLTVKSRDGEEKDRDEITLNCYCFKGKWYIDINGMVSRSFRVLMARDDR